MGIPAYILLSYLLLLLPCPADAEELSPFQESIKRAEEALADEDWDEARLMIDSAAERDPNSRRMWELRTKWAIGIDDLDEQVYCLHQQLRLARAQKASRKEMSQIREQLEIVDSIAPDLLDLKLVFIDQLLPIAKYYEKEGRPHSAIRVHNEILMLDPDRKESEDAIQRIASQPDPSLAESAKPKDLFADVSDEWIKEFNKKHDEWKTKGKLKLENYTTLTDAGYRILVMAGESMEQVNAFYRVFFDYGVDGSSVPHIELRIFKSREEYLKLGSNPPEWSGGLFTGSAVETFVGQGGFDSMIRTLFHEVGHQFVRLAAPGAASTTWLNEGMATYFEGCRVLSNGTVKMNMPANHYLFALTKRMANGWMTDLNEGLDPKNPEVKPDKAPTLEIVIGNKYRWGPAWYAPVWGVTYFFFNYQDPVDGRFVYRKNFREFTNSGGGRVGEGAVKKIESMILADPAKPTKGVDFSRAEKPIHLPKTVRELNETWKEWLAKMRDEESGRIEVKRPYFDWAKYAVDRKENDQALEHFEKGLVEDPENIELLMEFGHFLAEKLKNSDRASKLVRQAITILEFQDEIDEKAIRKAEKLLSRWDPKVRTLQRVHEQLWSSSKSLAQRYLDAGYNLMAMDVAWRFGTELGVPDIMTYFEQAVRRSGKSLWIWKLAYNEKDLDGWVASGDDAFKPRGRVLESKLGEYDPNKFDYQFLTLDTVTPGDFSIEAEVDARLGNITFCGLVFGKKGDKDCNSVILFPGGVDQIHTGSITRSAFVDLTSFYGSEAYKIWAHSSVKGLFPEWHTVRVDVSGKMVDVWFDNKLAATHEFPNLGVLRGNFGLITGLGKARFKNIRYLARPPRDPGARIEREIRMEKIMKKAEASGLAAGSVNGSWMGKVPPFPSIVRWVRNPRTKWEDEGPVPTIIAFWSIEQNEMIPIHSWLSYMVDKHSDVGLQVVNVVSADDKAKIEGYLENHPFPGSICLDNFRRKGYGDLFERYAIQDFGMPRILLLDVNHKVAWEGDPGFRIGTSWSVGTETYLDSPLDDLISRGNLKVFYQWRKDWKEGKIALNEGDLDKAIKVLTDARHFKADLNLDVAEAHRRIERLETTVDALDSMLMTLQRTECEPALETLIEWRRILGKKVDSPINKLLRTVMKTKVGADWEQALTLVNRTKKSMKKGNELVAMASLLKKLDPLTGLFPKILRKDLNFAVRLDNLEEGMRVLESADKIPAQWLAQKYFRW